MTARQIDVPAGTRRVLELATIYSQDWSVVEKRGENIEPADVSTASFLMKKRLSDQDADAAVTKTIGDGLTISSGKATVLLAASDTASLQGEYFATLRLYLTDGGVVDWQDEEFSSTPYIQLDFTQGAVEATS